MSTRHYFSLISETLQADDVDGEWFADICEVDQIIRDADGVRFRLNRGLDTCETREAAEIAFERCPSLEFFIYAGANDTVGASVAHMYEQWDWYDEERVELVIEMESGDNNWQEPFRYFSEVHDITVEHPPFSVTGKNGTYAEQEREFRRRWGQRDNHDADAGTE